MSYFDLKTQEIPNCLLLFFIPLLNFKFEALIIFFLLLLFFQYLENYIGGADLKIFLLMYCCLNFFDFITWLMISCLIALAYMLITQKQKIVLLPCLSIGLVVFLI